MRDLLSKIRPRMKRWRWVGVSAAVVLAAGVAAPAAAAPTQGLRSTESEGCSGIPTARGGNFCVFSRSTDTPGWNQSGGSLTDPAVRVAGDIFFNGNPTSSGGTRAGGQIGITGSNSPSNWRGNSVPPWNTPTPPATHPLTGQPPQTDPLAGRPFDPNHLCANSITPQGTGTRTLEPGTYGATAAANNTVVTLEPGVYALRGNLSYAGTGRIEGTGVTIYFCGSAFFNLGSNAGGVANLSAPGGVGGLLFYFDPANRATAMDFSNNSTAGDAVRVNLTGIIYAPNARLYSTGGSLVIYNITGDVVVGGFYWSGDHQLNIMAAPFTVPKMLAGYADGYRTVSTDHPNPWQGSDNVVFAGCNYNTPSTCSMGANGPIYDAGAVMLINSTAHSMIVTDATVIAGDCQYHPWPSLDATVPPGGDLILTQTGAPAPCPGTGGQQAQNFDTSELNHAPGTAKCTDNNGLHPVFEATVDSVPFEWTDEHQILNTGGVDPGAPVCGAHNETEQWVLEPAGHVRTSVSTRR